MVEASTSIVAELWANIKRKGGRTAVPAFDAERAKNLAKRAASLDGIPRGCRSRPAAGTALCAFDAEPASVEGEFAYDPKTMDKRVFRRYRGCDCLIGPIRDGVGGMLLTDGKVVSVRRHNRTG